MTHCEVTGIKTNAGEVTALAYQDRMDNSEHEVSVGVVVNAAGPWVDRVLQTAPANIGMQILSGLTR